MHVCYQFSNVIADLVPEIERTFSLGLMMFSNEID